MHSKFAFIHRKRAEYNKGRLSKYVQNNGLMEILKVSALFIALGFIIAIYLYYVTLASTRGYFLRQANQENDQIKFKYEVVKTELLDYKQHNRENMHQQRSRNEVVNIHTEVVQVPGAELTRR